MTMLVSAAAVRDYIELNPVPSSSRYTNATIGSNILAVQSALEQACGRYFVNRTFTHAAPWIGTTMNRQQMPIPGFRTITAVYRSTAALALNQSYWLTPDVYQTGVYTSIAFRAAVSPDLWRGTPGTPFGPWISNPQWFDTAADSPFYPPNVGGGLYLTSMPNDLAIEGSAGYDETLPVDTQGGPPSALLDVITIWAAFKTMRPATVMTDVAITPAGGVLNYSQLPMEVRDFIAAWRVGQQAVTVG